MQAGLNKAQDIRATCKHKLFKDSSNKWKTISATWLTMITITHAKLLLPNCSVLWCTSAIASGKPDYLHITVSFCGYILIMFFNRTITYLQHRAAFMQWTLPVPVLQKSVGHLIISPLCQPPEEELKTRTVVYTQWTHCLLLGICETRHKITNSSQIRCILYSPPQCKNIARYGIIFIKWHPSMQPIYGYRRWGSRPSIIFHPDWNLNNIPS